MLSVRRLQANRANAQKSTGPRTVVGLSASSQNALRHGFCSASTVVLDGVEDVTAYEQFASQVLNDLDAQGAIETALAERVAQLFWRLWRVTLFETQSVSQWQQALFPQPEHLAVRAAALATSERMTGALSTLFLPEKHELDYETVLAIREALLGCIGDRGRQVLAVHASDSVSAFMSDPLPRKRYTVHAVRQALLSAGRRLQQQAAGTRPYRYAGENLLARLYKFWVGAGGEWQEAERGRIRQRTAGLLLQIDRMAVVERYEPRLRRDLSRTLTDLRDLQEVRKTREWDEASQRSRESTFLQNEPIALSGDSNERLHQ